MNSIPRKPVGGVPAIHPAKESQISDSEAGFPPLKGESSTDRHTGEHSIVGQNRSNLRQRLDAKIDRVLPPHRKYCGLSRRWACLIVTVVLLILLALIIGLAIGLPLRNESQHKTLPLGSQAYTGDLTYYGTGLGACGVVAHDNDDIVSISHFVFDAVSESSNPNGNPLCGHKIRAVRNGNSVDLTVVDRCVGCQSTDIDVSTGAFQRLANLDLGRVTVTWAWLPPLPST